MKQVVIAGDTRSKVTGAKAEGRGRVTFSCQYTLLAAVGRQLHRAETGGCFRSFLKGLGAVCIHPRPHWRNTLEARMRPERACGQDGCPTLSSIFR